MNHSRFNIFLNPKNISIKDRGFNYGDGLFETILVKDSKILYLKEHVERLHDGCNILHLKKPSFLIIKDNIKKVIGRNKNCIIKIILTRGDNSFGYKIPIDIKHNLYFIRNKKYIPITNKNMVRLGISTYNTYDNPNLARIKHLNRIDQCLIAEDLNKRKNLNDLVVLNKNYIVETLSSNLFFIKKSKSEYIFHTPKIDNFGIKGIIRDKLISYLKNNKLRVDERYIPLSDLTKYNIAFKVNSIQGLIFIDEIENKKFSHDEIIYNKLKKFIY
ncbi:MAG: aminodeoxychorismate lyase [Pseudomonadota bacterium]|nr:aminodeoxychorismate lyase [Pseudomonadota bacterium]